MEWVKIIPSLIVFKATLELGYGVFLMLGSHYLEQGEMSAGNFLLFLVLGNAFLTPIKEVAAMGEMYKVGH